MEHVMIIKVDFDGDMRRISMTLAEEASTAEKLKEIRSSVAQGFDIEEPSLPPLKYRDDEGDLCTLVEASVEDLLQLSTGGTMRLFASKSEVGAPLVAKTPAVATEPPKVEASSAKEVTTKPESAAEDSRGSSAVDDRPPTPEVEEALRRWRKVPQNEAAPPAAAPQEEAAAASAQQTVDASSIDELTGMGFSKEQAELALECANGDVQMAVEYLINGKRTEQHSEDGAQPRCTPFEKLEKRVRSLPCDVRDQLQKVRDQLLQAVANVKQHRVQVQEGLPIGETFQLLNLEATLKEVLARLCEFKEIVQGALAKVTGGQRAATEEADKLRKVEEQIADANRFLCETLAAVHSQRCEMMKASEAQEGATEVMEAMAAVVTAAIDAALVAMANVDDILFDETSCPSTSSSTSIPANDASQQQGAKNATRLDHAQVFLSKSISALRSQACGLIKAGRPDTWVTIPSRVSTSSASAGYAASHTAAPASTSSGPDPEDANVASAAATGGHTQSSGLDAFLLESAPAQGNEERRS